MIKNQPFIIIYLFTVDKKVLHSFRPKKANWSQPQKKLIEVNQKTLKKDSLSQLIAEISKYMQQRYLKSINNLSSNV